MENRKHWKRRLMNKFGNAWNNEIFQNALPQCLKANNQLTNAAVRSKMETNSQDSSQ